MAEMPNLAEMFKLPIPPGLEFTDPLLVVDDQQDLRLILVHQLRKLGFSQVIHAGNGIEALEALQKLKRIGLLMVDMEMPGMGGIEFLQEISDNPQYLRGPYVLMMDGVTKEKVLFAVENGADEILKKPFTLGDIMPKSRQAFKAYHNPKNPEKVYELAKQAFRDGKLDLAEKVYLTLQAAAPKSARATVFLARIALLRKDMKRALELLAEGEQRNPSYVHVHAVRGEIFGIQEKWDDAIAAFSKAIELSPLNPVRYKQVSEVLFRQKKYKEAVPILQRGLDLGVGFKEMHHYLSQAYYATKDYLKAIKHIRSALQQDPENVTYLNQLGISYKEAQEFEEATKVYNTIIKIDPENKAALYNKAVMLNAQGDTVEAIRILERLVRIKPDFEAAKAKLEEYRKALMAPKAPK